HYFLLMATAYLTRKVSFAAAHRYRRPEWSDEQNEKTFGLCARESFHGHSYVCEVTVAGEIDPLTGFIADLGELDAILSDEVKDRFDHRNINVDVPEFGDGKLIPSGENLARFIFDRVASRLPAKIRIDNVKIAEDRTLSATYRGEE
ncbi:MAG TPA: 6-carboxytetrahydropterin synthase, partial [Gemmatimonadaceae bacterium]|nr:6-carboxytetrahydropterin synthase [Gemmatimonadaceae bacterium]